MLLRNVFAYTSGKGIALLRDCFLRVLLMETMRYCGISLWKVLRVASFCIKDKLEF